MIKFPYFDVCPLREIVIRDVAENVLVNSKGEAITSGAVRLKKVEGGLKRIYVVFSEETVNSMGYIPLLESLGLIPCINAPHYLLGLMNSVPEEQMPEMLKDKSIVAAEPDNPDSMFRRNGDGLCFLGVYRKLLHREFRLTVTNRPWPNIFAFLGQTA